MKGEISAGTVPAIDVVRGECAQVMTGAPIPPGADAVVRVEDTSGFDSRRDVEFYRPARARENIRFRGEEIEKGETVVPVGRRLGAAETGTLATFGYAEVEAYRKPKVAIFATGDELKSPGEPLRPGEIYDSNLPVMRSLVDRVGAELVVEEEIGDNPAKLKQFFERALSLSDVILSSGGISMGRYDFVRAVLADMGLRERFWGVSQKPGKPLFFGTMEKILVFGLPGNPVSVFICFMEYVWPTFERCMGLEPQRKLEAVLSEPFPRDPVMHRFLFGNFWTDRGIVKCAPTKKLGSHMLTSAVGANAILESGPGKDHFKEGDRIKVSPLPWESMGNQS